MSASTEPQKTTLTVRTTQNPTEEVEVTVKEYIDLQRQGLIFEGTETEAQAAVEPEVSTKAFDPYNPPADEPEKAPSTTKKKEA